MLEALLLAGGQQVGAYSSPHINAYNERIRLAGRAAADATIVDAFGRVEQVRGDEALTYFEFGTLAALCIFDAAGVDTMLLEIGLGGRLDAVNAVEPDAGIITNVALDHCDWLGDNLESIGFEKAGILRAGKPFVFAGPSLPVSVAKHAAAIGAELRVAGQDYSYAQQGDGGWGFNGRSVHISGLRRPSAVATYQVQNAAGVLALAEAMGETALLNADLIHAAWDHTALPGRLQFVERERQWILDVAHNVAGAEALATSLAELDMNAGVSCLIGVLDDKDLPGIVAALSPLVTQWLAVTADGHRAVPAHEVARVIANLTGSPCHIAASVIAACTLLDATGPDIRPVLVTGSFMTVGPVMRWLEADAG